MQSMSNNKISDEIAPTYQDSKRKLNIKIENFGPISKGEIELKPLTVFIGPNGCGKSHAATLLYAMSNIEQDYEYAFSRYQSLNMSHNARLNLVKEEAKKIKKEFDNGMRIISTDILQRLDNSNFTFQQLFKNNFSVSYKNLIQKRKKCASLTVKSQLSDCIKIELSSGDISVTGFKRPLMQVVFKKSSTGTNDELKTDPMTTINVLDSNELFDIYDALVERLSGSLNLMNNAYYFPAERAGLTMAHKVLTTFYLGHPKRRPLRVNLPTVATDYLSLLTMLPEKYGTFRSITKDAEKHIIGGEIIIEKNQEYNPVIYFKKSQSKFHLNVSASSVKDLALFFIYSKFIAKYNDLIILEEPETNLHPKAQIALAKFIAQLISGGLYVVVTTHSPYFLEQLSHCVMSGQISTDKNNSPLRPDESIARDDVASYKFIQVKGNYQIEQIIIEEEGIPQDEFLNIDETMYGELLKMRNLIND